MTLHSYHDYGQNEVTIRSPFKLLQRLVVDYQQRIMSASRKCGVNPRTNVPRQNKYGKLSDTNKGTLPARQLDISSKSSLPSKSKNWDKPSSRDKSPRVESPTSADDASYSETIKTVHSLGASPKWSRIKDKFEPSKLQENNLTSRQNNKPALTSRLAGTTHHRNIKDLNGESISKPLNSNRNSFDYKATMRGKDCKPSALDSKYTPSTNISRRVPKSTKGSSLDYSASDKIELSKNVPIRNTLKNNIESSVPEASKIIPTNSGYSVRNVYNKKNLQSSTTKVAENVPNSSLPVSKTDVSAYRLNVSQNSKYTSSKNAELSRTNSTSSGDSDRSFATLKFQSASRKLSSSSGDSEKNPANSNIQAASRKRLDLDLNLDSSNLKQFGNAQKERSMQHVNRNGPTTMSNTNKVLPSELMEGNNKNLWVKDEFGNWTKSLNKKGSDKQQQQSNVANLRSKFSSKLNEIVTSHCKNVLEKSKTDSNVPFAVESGNISKLLKSSTESNILFTSQDSESDAVFCDVKKETQRTRMTSSSSNSSDSSGRLSINSADQSPGRSRKLSLVQRAVLSYEENLSLLSPETQRKLKLLGEKVKSQNEEDALIMNKHTIFTQNGITDKNVKCQESRIRHDNNKQNNDVSKFGEPLQPVRNFLNRYKNSEKQLTKGQTKDETSMLKKNTFDNKPVKAEVSNCSQGINNNLKSSSIDVSVLAKRFVPQDSRNDEKGDAKQLPNKVQANIERGKSLRPNSSFLWRTSKRTGSTSDSTDSTNDSRVHNYCVLENYYSETDNTKKSYSAQSDSSTSLKLTGGEVRYQNIEQMGRENKDDGWTDMSDDDANCKSTSSKSSTLKRRKLNRNSHCKGNLQRSWSQSFRDMANNLQTQSSEGSKQDSTTNEYDTEYNYGDHLYEPVYESLGNYLTSDDNNDQEVPSLSPDDEQTKEIYSSYTSLESMHSDKVSNEQNKSEDKCNSPTREPSAGIGKKATSKIRQLRRHLSWSKSDIKLELSSKFNKIKIKKNGQNGTEIGVRVQENGSTSTSPKKNTFIKCILKQKSCNNIPVKKTPSPKKESSLFYVHLSMKQRPFSDSCIGNNGPRNASQEKGLPGTRKISDPIIDSSQLPAGRPRKRSSGQVIQRPTTAPPEPPTAAALKLRNSNLSQKDKSTANMVRNSLNSENRDSCSSMNGFTKANNVIGPTRNDCQEHNMQRNLGSNSPTPLYATIESVTPQRKRNSIASSTSYDSYAMADESGSSGTSSSTTYSSGFTLHIESDVGPIYASARNLHLPLGKDGKNENIKSPFEEEPLYQFYHKDVQQRATLWYSADGSESEFDDYAVEKVAVNEESSPVKVPLLQTQTSAMDLIHGQHGLRTLWGEVPEVKDSGILNSITSQDRKIQEAMFEVITSEASYLKSLNFLLEHFVNCPDFCPGSSDKHILDKRERHILFSDVQPVRDVSASVLADLEKRWLENIVLSNICDIIYHHASKYFSVYVKYCSNQIYQERTLKQLKESRPRFLEILKGLESSSVCQGLDMHSFLMLPMQRITRLPLLVDAIFHRLDIDSPIYESCKMALALLNKLVAECNEGARKMERMEEMLVISHHLDFRDCKGLGLLSASRWLVKKGELVQLVSDSNSKRTFGRTQRWCKVRLFLFLFTDLLVITEKKSDDSYCVIDYCLRNMVQVMLVDENNTSLPSRLPSGYRNVFQLIMLSNREGKTVEMLLSCLLESDRTRWIDAVTPPKSENPDEKIYEEWDCPQVQCTHAYLAQQPDEVSIEEADVLNVFRKMSDGWYEGERIRDGVKGWFPSSHTMEIANSHMRARNLRQRYRLLVLSQTYLEEQQKAQIALSAKAK